jgi:DNA-binding winged helix-turn-helix (wHTH) protein
LKKKFICIFSFNEDISLYPDTLSRYSYLSSVNQNLFYFPYASDAEMSELISQNEARFNVNLTKSQVNEIHTQTGGVPYLVKSYFKDTQVTPDAINNLLSGFTSQQISYLKNKSPKVSESFHKLGITDSLGNIICPHIATAVQSFRLTSELVVDEEKSTLSVGKQKISDELMSYEKEIIFKLYSQNRMSREEIALICYGSKKSSNYSDYAIDKIISRLRLNLKRIGVNPKIIQTNRGFGYSLNTNVQ